MSNEERIKQLRSTWNAKPEGEQYHELCELLGESAKGRAEAREICFKALTANPGDLVGRLVLARLFYQDGYYEYSIRELVELYSRSEAPAIKKLLDAFGAHAARYMAAKVAKPAATTDPVASKVADIAEVVAEIDIDDEFLEAIDELK